MPQWNKNNLEDRKEAGIIQESKEDLCRNLNFLEQ